MKHGRNDDSSTIIRHSSEGEWSVDLSMAAIFNFGLISKKTLMIHRKASVQSNLQPPLQQSERKQTQSISPTTKQSHEQLKKSDELYLNLEDSSQEVSDPQYISPPRKYLTVSQDINTTPKIGSNEGHFTTEKGDDLSSCNEASDEEEKEYSGVV